MGTEYKDESVTRDGQIKGAWGLISLEFIKEIEYELSYCSCESCGMVLTISEALSIYGIPFSDLSQEQLEKENEEEFCSQECIDKYLEPLKIESKKNCS